MKLKFFSPPMPYDAPPMLVLFMLCIGQANGGLKVNKGAFLLVGDKLSRFGGLSSFLAFRLVGLVPLLGVLSPLFLFLGLSLFWGVLSRPILDGLFIFRIFRIPRLVFCSFVWLLGLVCRRILECILGFRRFCSILFYVTPPCSPFCFVLLVVRVAGLVVFFPFVGRYKKILFPGRS